MLLRRHTFVAVLAALTGCSFPAPYQTYSPDSPVEAPAPTQNALTVYGSNTTTPDREMDYAGPENAQSLTATPVQSPAASTATSPVPASTNPRIAICYNHLWSASAAINNAATQACGEGRVPRLVSQGLDLDACPVLTPTRAIFACGPASPSH